MLIVCFCHYFFPYFTSFYDRHFCLEQDHKNLKNTYLKHSSNESKGNRDKLSFKTYTKVNNIVVEGENDECFCFFLQGLQIQIAERQKPAVN